MTSSSTLSAYLSENFQNSFDLRQSNSNKFRFEFIQSIFESSPGEIVFSSDKNENTWKTPKANQIPYPK